MTNNKKLSDLNFDTKNANKHTAKGHKALEDSLQKYGAGRSILVDKNNNIIAGNLTAEVFGQIGLEDVQIVESDGKKLIVVKRTDVDINSKAGRELAISDNRASELSLNWDSDALMDLQKNFKVDLSEFFSNKELKLLGLDNINLNEEDFEFPDEIKTDIILGDLFEIGEHRLLCGNSTNSDSVAKLMNGQKADMVFTSPPYNGNTTMYDYIIVDGKKKRKDKPLYENNESDNKTSEDYIDFLHSVMNICFINTYGYIFWNINYNAKSRFEFLETVYPYREKLQETIIWKKNAIPTANGFTRNFEFIFMFKTDEEIKHLNKEYDVTHNIWDINNSSSQTDTHKACFPIGLPSKAIELNEKTKLVFDPFLGSGTTMVASHQLKRKCYGMEIEPKYCQVILDRMIKLDSSLKIIKNGKHS